MQHGPGGMIGGRDVGRESKAASPISQGFNSLMLRPETEVIILTKAVGQNMEEIFGWSEKDMARMRECLKELVMQCDLGEGKFQKPDAIRYIAQAQELNAEQKIHVALSFQQLISDREYHARLAAITEKLVLRM